MAERIEYEWAGVDAVIELPEGTDKDVFFERLVDAVIEEVESVGGRIGGSLGQLREWQEGDDEGA